jgi:hypothetical protein
MPSREAYEIPLALVTMANSINPLDGYFGYFLECFMLHAGVIFLLLFPAIPAEIFTALVPLSTLFPFECECICMVV